jgi:hypothetical protein
MTPKTCDVCGKVFSTNFCPACGRKYDDIKVDIPVEIITYVHSNKEDGYDLCEKFGIDPKSDLGEKLIYINYEVKLVYNIVKDKLVLKQINAGDGQGLCDVIPTKK